MRGCLCPAPAPLLCSRKHFSCAGYLGCWAQLAGTILQDEEPGHSLKGHPAGVRGLLGPRGGCPGTHGQELGVGAAPTGPPGAPRLPNAAAEPGQLLQPCPRAAALRSRPCSARSRLRSHGCSGCGSDLETPNPLFPRTQQGLSLQGCTRGHRPLRCPAWGCHRTQGALPGLGMGSRASQTCNEQRPCVPANPGHSWPRDRDSERPARSSLPGFGRNDSTHSPVSPLLFFNTVHV